MYLPSAERESQSSCRSSNDVVDASGKLHPIFVFLIDVSGSIACGALSAALLPHQGDLGEDETVGTYLSGTSIYRWCSPVSATQNRVIFKRSTFK